MTGKQRVLVVDDDVTIRDSLSMMLRSAGYEVRCFASAQEFLAEPFDAGGCVIADVRMPGMGGLELQEEIARADLHLPVIFVTGHGDVSLAVRAMKSGAVDFIEKPFRNEALVASVERALEIGRQWRDRAEAKREAQHHLAMLTARERDVLERLVKGNANKVVALDLGISPRTVEIHRANIMSKLNARSLSDLVRLAMAAAEGPLEPAPPHPPLKTAHLKDKAAATAPRHRAGGPAAAGPEALPASGGGRARSCRRSPRPVGPSTPGCSIPGRIRN